MDVAKNNDLGHPKHTVGYPKIVTVVEYFKEYLILKQTFNRSYILS